MTFEIFRRELIHKHKRFSVTVQQYYAGYIGQETITIEQLQVERNVSDCTLCPLLSSSIFSPPLLPPFTFVDTCVSPSLGFNYKSIPSSCLWRRSVHVEVHGREANQQLDATAAADKGQAVGSFFSPSPFAAGFESSRTGADPCSSDSLLMGSGQGSQVSSVTEATVAAIDTATPAESLPSEVPPKAPHPQVLHENDTAFCRTAATGEDFQHLPHFTETDPLMSEPVTPAAGAIDDRSDVGWQNAATGRQRSALGAAVPAGDAAPNVALFEGELGFEQEEVHLTDADLVDMAAVLTGEEGLLDTVLL